LRFAKGEAKDPIWMKKKIKKIKLRCLLIELIIIFNRVVEFGKSKTVVSQMAEVTMRVN
jgi:hypothetical protein